MYSYDLRVSFSNSDLDHRMTIPAIIDAFQDCSCFHSDQCGVGFAYLEPRNLVWVINYWEVDFERIPMYGEKITVGTFPYSFKAVMGNRNFYLKSETGEYLAKANSIWVLMDWEKMKMSMPTPEIVNAYELGEKLDMSYESRKIEEPVLDGGEYIYKSGVKATTRECETVTIQKHHLDSNGHVNNGQYIKIAMDLITSYKEYKRLRVEYRNQAHLGDVIVPKMYVTDNNYVISLQSEDAVVYAVVELRF